ncbi:glycosyltransferase [uncultured Clostridium sp.]|uniref:glycosyltransferase n=1 Tax=uncultured Clostridium sp. TaxID=59620 RepID=UPI0028E30041|nr:glycosyltransferase [uncultured Clostridium sp.]
MKKVLIIAYYFPPLGWSGVQRTLKFVKYLREFGWEPIVVTVGKSKFSVLDESLMKEIPKDIKLVRIDDIKFKDVTDRYKEEMMNLVKYSFDNIDENLRYEYETMIENKFAELRNLFLMPDGNAIWANSVIDKIEKKININEIDVLFTTSAPYSSHLIGLYLKDKYGIPLVCDFRDEWTNNPYISLDNKSLRYKIERSLEANILNKADRVITITSISSENYIKDFSIDEEKVNLITNGYDEEDFKFNRNNKCKSRKFKIVYNGSLYTSINPYTFIQAIMNLIRDDELKTEDLEIIFNGKIESEILNNILNMSNSINKNVIINGYLSHEESLKISSTADVLLLIIGDGEKAKSVYTGKVFEYLRLGIPIIALSPKNSLIDKLLVETNSGVNVEYDNIFNIQKEIKVYYEKWKNGYIVKINRNKINKYERKELTKKLVNIFREISC